MSIVPYEDVIVKWAEHKQAAAKVAKRLLKIAENYDIPEEDLVTTPYLIRRAGRMAHCGDQIDYQYCPDCGSMHLSRTWLCRDRICPLCAWRLSLKRTGEMMRVLTTLQEDGIRPNAAMLTLTMRNVAPRDLSDAIDTLLTAWRKLSKRKRVTDHVIGYARSIEVTDGAKGTLHPHVHALLLFDPDYTKDIKQREWSAIWKNCLGVDYTPIVDIRAAYYREDKNDAIMSEWQRIAKATIEATKYAVKSSDLAQISDSKLDAIRQGLHARMLIAYGGVIRDARKRLNYNDSDEPDAPNDTTIDCPKCGCADLIDISYGWAVEASGYKLAPMRAYTWARSQAEKPDTVAANDAPSL